MPELAFSSGFPSEPGVTGMQIGLIGAGQVARAFARKAIAAGHTVVFSDSRGGEGLATTAAAFGPSAAAGTAAEAAACEIALLATPWLKVEQVLRTLPPWRGRILIDPTNAFSGDTPGQGVVRFETGSSSETVQSLAPEALVIKAMNTLFMSNFEQEPVAGSMRRALFLSGDDIPARNRVADLFESFGFAPVILGSLAHGGRIQALAGPIAGHDFFLPWPAKRFFPLFSGISDEER